MPELHQVGYAAIFDGTRIPAPISQDPPPSAEYLRLSAGPELAGVAFSVYDHGGQKDAVTGWRHLRLVDRVTGLPMVWVDRPAVVDEAAVLVDVPVPMLFKLWSGCPLEIIISDGALDQARACGELEAATAHPVFPRRTPKHLTVTAKRGVKFTTVNGQPCCDCRPDQEMAFIKREGFLGAAERRNKGIPRGVLAPNIIKNARIRWKCPNDACNAERTTYALKSVGGQMWPYANDHLWFPLRGGGKHTHLRKMLLLYRNLVESSFSFQKARGVGSKQPARWAKDHGFVHLMGMHLTLRTACRLAHENGSYAVLEAEHTTLGLARDTSHPPSLERMLDLRNKRPPHPRWAWPKPQRLPLSQTKHCRRAQRAPRSSPSAAKLRTQHVGLANTRARRRFRGATASVGGSTGSRCSPSGTCERLDQVRAAPAEKPANTLADRAKRPDLRAFQTCERTCEWPTMELLGLLSNPKTTAGLCRLVDRARSEARSDRVRKRRPALRIGLGIIPDAIVAVLRDADEHGMRVCDIHATVEELLRQPVPSSSVKNSLAVKARGEAAVFERVGRGRYRLRMRPVSITTG